MNKLKKQFPINNPLVNDTDKSEIYEVLMKHAAVISKGPHDLGSSTFVEHEIDTGDAPPQKNNLVVPHLEKGQ